jgi:integrase
MRRSELLGLRWEDIDLASGSLCFFSSDGAGTTYGTRTQATLLLKRRGGAHVRQCHRVYRVQPVDDPVDVDERDEALAKRVLARAFRAGAGLNPATFGS